MRLLTYDSLPLQFREVVYQIPITTVFQHDIDCIVLLHDIFNPDDMLVLSECEQGFDFLSGCGDNMFDGLDILF